MVKLAKLDEANWLAAMDKLNLDYILVASENDDKEEEKEDDDGNEKDYGYT